VDEEIRLLSDESLKVQEKMAEYSAIEEKV